MKNLPRKIAIIGVGLIGGSIALGLKRHFGQKISISGSCKDPKRTKLALNKGIVNSVFDHHKLSPQVRLIILAAPVSTNIKMLQKIVNKCRTGTLIIDVGSTKEIICNRAENILPKGVFFLGTHPMAGKETSGFENASADLFKNKLWIICPTKKSRAKDIRLMKQLIKLFAAKPVILDPKLHDRIAAQTSHLPSLIACGLVNTVIAKITSTGFADTTRLASQNPKMMLDIVQTNKNNILFSLKLFQTKLKKLEQIISSDDSHQLMNYLLSAKRTRDTWMYTKI